MSAETNRLASSWLAKAAEDLASARKLGSEPEPLLATALYHCQQAAEKAIKSYLVHRNQPFEKTHDIDRLMLTALRHDAGFDAWREVGDILTRYATIYRYPGAITPPTEEDFEEAIQAADGVYRFVLSLLPAEVHPPR